MRTKLAVVSLFSLFVAALLLAPVYAQAAEKAAGPKVGGYFQADFYAGDDPAATPVDSSFFMRRVRLAVGGSIPKTIVSYKIVGGFDGANSGSTGSSANLLDAWVNLKFDPLFQVRVGQFKYTFDREGRESGSAIPFAMRPAVVNGIVGALGQTGGSFRDIGIEVHGGAKTPIAWKYAVGILNGNGVNVHDNNNNKDVYLRGEIEPVKGLSFGAGYFSGKVGTTTKTDESGWTIDAQYHIGPLAVRGAYYKGDYDLAPSGSREPEGWYILGSYKVLPNLDLLLRYQEYDSDSNLANRKYDSFDVGLNYYFARKGAWGGTKLVLNYMFRDAEASAGSRVWEERGATATGVGVDDLFIARLQVAF